MPMKGESVVMTQRKRAVRGQKKATIMEENSRANVGEHGGVVEVDYQRQEGERSFKCYSTHLSFSLHIQPTAFLARRGLLPAADSLGLSTFPISNRCGRRSPQNTKVDVFPSDNASSVKPSQDSERREG